MTRTLGRALALGLLATGLASPGTAGASAVTFQADAGHTGYVARGGPAPPLARRWVARLPGRVGYPVVAGDRVFVIHSVRSPQLVALSLRTGRRLWTRSVDSPRLAFVAALAYDAGRVFVTRADDGYTRYGGLLAFDATDGRLVWTAPYAGGATPPVAHEGVIYLAGDDALSARRQADGALLWSTSTGDAGTGPSPTVAGDVVAVGLGCPPHVFRARRADGAPLTALDTSCSSGNGETLALAGGRLLNPGPIGLDGAGIYDVATGARVGAHESAEIPAVAPGGVIVRADGRRPPEFVRYGLTLIAEAGGRRLWSFRGDGYIDSTPLIAGRTVYAGSGGGRVFAVDLRTGRKRWEGDAGGPVPAARFKGVPTGLAAAGGLLLVPTRGRLVAFGHRGRR